MTEADVRRMVPVYAAIGILFVFVLVKLLYALTLPVDELEADEAEQFGWIMGTAVAAIVAAAVVLVLHVWLTWRDQG